MSFKLFTELEAYKACRQFRKRIADLVAQFPEDEKYRLKDQLIRSSRSVTACLAEGHGRYYYKENVAFCRKSRGSLTESLEHLITAYDHQYITLDELNDFKSEVDSCGKLLNGYIRFLKKEKPHKDQAEFD